MSSEPSSSEDEAPVILPTPEDAPDSAASSPASPKTSLNHETITVELMGDSPMLVAKDGGKQAVWKAQRIDSGEEILISGPMIDLKRGMRITAQGSWRRSATYGLHFSADSFVPAEAPKTGAVSTQMLILLLIATAAVTLLIGVGITKFMVDRSVSRDRAALSQNLPSFPLQSDAIAPGAIGEVQIAPGAVGGGQVRPGSVGDTALADASVTSDKIADGAVIEGKIAEGSMPGSILLPESLEGDRLVENSVAGSKIEDGSIGDIKLEDNSITRSKLAQRSVGTAQLQNGAVGSAQIKNGAVGAAQLAPDAIPSAVSLLPTVRRTEFNGTAGRVGCRDDEWALGGGVDAGNGEVIASVPILNNNRAIGWQARISGSNSGSVYVICVPR